MKKSWMKKSVVALLSALTLGLTGFPAEATDLPAGVLNYLRQKDPGVKVRFDGLVLLSHGETYVPVIPQDPALNPEPQQVIMSLPEDSVWPDLVQFDNHFFLVKLIQTASGRLTFPKMAEYPIQLREGLLPQDFVLPDNLYIPVELKVILGGLPYNPSYTPPKNPVPAPAASVLKALEMPAAVGVSSSPTPSVPVASAPRPLRQRVSYVFDLNEQKIQAIDAVTGRRQTDIRLDCVPATLKVSEDGRLLFAPCLSTNELVVVDTGSNLVKTRVAVGQRPDGALYVDALQSVVVSSRYSPYLSVVNVNNLMMGEKISLPGGSSVLALIPGDNKRLLAADPFKPDVHVVDLNSRTVEKTLKTLPDISAMRVVLSGERPELWVSSRSSHQVMGVDLATGRVIKTLSVGKKPVELGVSDGRLYVLSAGDARLDVIDLASRQAMEPIALSGTSFPSAMMVLPSEHRAYVVAAGAEGLTVVNLETMRVETALPAEFRASLIGMTPDAAASDPAMLTVQPAQALPPMTAGEPEAVPVEVPPALPDSKPDSKKEAKKAAKADKAKKRQKTEPATEEAAQSTPAQGAAPMMPVMPALGTENRLPTENSGKFTFKFGKSKMSQPAATETGLPQQLPAKQAPASRNEVEDLGADGSTGAQDDSPPMLDEINR